MDQILNKNGHCISDPPFEGLGPTFTVHLRLTGKYIVQFLFVLIELFLLDVVAVLRANVDWKSPFLKGMGQFRQKCQVEGDVHRQPFCTVR